MVDLTLPVLYYKQINGVCSLFKDIFLKIQGRNLFLFLVLGDILIVLINKGYVCICVCVHGCVNFNDPIKLTTDYIITYFLLTLSAYGQICGPLLNGIFFFATCNLYIKLTYIPALLGPIFSSLFSLFLNLFHVLYHINICMST